jgi:glutamate dehydrogenase (NAD(P)+)
MSELINAFQMAQAQFDQVARQLDMDPQVAEILRWPSREFKFRSVHMDDGSIRDSPAFAADNDARSSKAAFAFTPLKLWTRCAPWQCG